MRCTISVHGDNQKEHSFFLLKLLRWSTASLKIIITSCKSGWYLLVVLWLIYMYLHCQRTCWTWLFSLWWYFLTHAPIFHADRFVLLNLLFYSLIISWLKNQTHCGLSETSDFLMRSIPLRTRMMFLSEKMHVESKGEAAHRFYAWVDLQSLHFDTNLLLSSRWNNKSLRIKSWH